jgi:hypothetical protein
MVVTFLAIGAASAALAELAYVVARWTLGG